ncbi:hypothetical protein [Mariniblastus fucicola]|uniref:DUF1573 domain-containing protein n=1 Tax=Mariniblastus fucicola TaxID=980251 RepID=A0A5B9PH81_9BACT|nr:hypothetical protein [Mariniblastus fucicola]QEG24072.1 hypothetical protein MFFC18_39880 [Mariniblastus fucicola]
MRVVSLILLLVAVGFCSVAGLGQSIYGPDFEKLNSVVTAQEIDVVSTDSVEIDIGSLVREISQLGEPFVIKLPFAASNQNDAKLILKSKSCSCVAKGLDEIKIKAGSVNFIDLEFKSNGKSVQVFKHYLKFSRTINGNGASDFVVVLKGKIVRPYCWIDLHNDSFRVSKQTTDVDLPGLLLLGNFDEVDCKCSDPRFRVDIHSQSKARYGGIPVMDLSLVLSGKTDELLSRDEPFETVLVLDLDGQSLKIPLELSAARSSFRVNPERLFVSAKLGNTKRRFRIVGSKPFKVKRIASDAKFLRIEREENLSDSLVQTFSVEFMAIKTEKNQANSQIEKCQIELVVDDESETNLDVEVYAQW